MTDDERLTQIFRAKGSDPDVMFLISRLDICATVLGNFIAEMDKMDPKPEFEAYTSSHARALAGFEKTIVAIGARI